MSCCTCFALIRVSHGDSEANSGGERGESQRVESRELGGSGAVWVSREKRGAATQVFLTSKGAHASQATLSPTLLGFHHHPGGSEREGKPTSLAPTPRPFGQDGLLLGL